MKIPNLRYSLLPAVLLLLCALAAGSCASHRAAQSGAQQAAVLSPEAQRRYDYFFLEALRLKEKQEYDAAYELLRHCLQINPRAASALYEISQFYLALKQPEKALACMQQAAHESPDNYWYKQSLAIYHLQANQLAEAIGVYEQMAVQFPTNLEPLMALTDLYSRTGNYAGMIHSLDRMEEIQGKSEMVSMNKFRAYLLMNDGSKAFREMENLAAEYPFDLRYRTILGDLYLDNNKPQEAYDIYRQVLEKEPDNPLALTSLAEYYKKTGQDDRYRQQLDTIMQNPHVGRQAKMDILRQCIIRSEQTDRDSTQIVALFDKALRLPQSDADLYMLYAQYLITKKMYAESKPVLHSILALDPENLPARIQLLDYASRENDAEEIIRICSPAIRYMPDKLEFYFYIGLAQLQLQRPDESIRVLEEGIGHINSQSDKIQASDLYALLGDLYHERNRDAETFAAYDSALVYNPNNNGVLNNYAYYLSLKADDLDRAEEMSYRTVKSEPENHTYLDTYAWILFRKGRYTEAKIYIDSALQNGGMESAVEVEHAGDIYYHCNEPVKALELWIKARELGETSDILDRKIKQKKYIAKP